VKRVHVQTQLMDSVGINIGIGSIRLNSTNGTNGTNGTDESNNTNSTSTSTSTSTSSNKTTAKTEDPFGVNYTDPNVSNYTNDPTATPKSSSSSNQENEMPPQYIRDESTGKFTGEIKRTLSSNESHVLNLDRMRKEQELVIKLNECLNGKTSYEAVEKVLDMAKAILEEDTSISVLGRKVSDVSPKSVNSSNDTEEEEDSMPSITAPLSSDETKSLHKFMKKTSNKDDPLVQNLLSQTDDLIPTTARLSSTQNPMDYYYPQGNNNDSDPSNNNNKSKQIVDPDLEWMTAPAQRAMAGDLQDDPFANLHPSDLNPARKVNRKRAKLLPKHVLHHNNLALLRRYITPGGQIMNRKQSRLGAKDQRKIAKLIKRARNLGLIPTLGQWMAEDTGNVRHPDLIEERDWEKKLIERGFVERKSHVWKSGQKELQEE